jgi:peptidyl-dipeptidase A
VDGNKLSDNEVEDVLKTSKDSEHLKKTWLAHKEIGPLVKDDIINLVKMRNEAARELGFKNYHAMSLALSEQDPEMIENLFDELDELTRGAFAEVKAEMDTKLAAQYGIKPEELMPWHYQNRYFQEAPAIYDADLDAVYTKYDKEGIVKLTEDYFAGLNLPIDKLVAKSDLFEKEGKNQHAYCINIDRDSNDIRVLCNVVPNSRWMETMLHEYGHALYENYYPQDIPWNLKTPAHIFTTEAIAMLFGRFALNPEWMQEMTGISDEEKEEIAEAAVKTMRLQQLVFSRWAQVMYRFEKAMYENPDQDLNKLWWDIVEKYQMIKIPLSLRDISLLKGRKIKNTLFVKRVGSESRGDFLSHSARLQSLPKHDAESTIRNINQTHGQPGFRINSCEFSGMTRLLLTSDFRLFDFRQINLKSLCHLVTSPFTKGEK